MKTKDECGIWIDDQKMITNKFSSDYAHRFKSAHGMSWIILELDLCKILSDLDNQDLIKLPNLNQVKTALFRIGSNKTLGPDGFGA